MVDPTRSPRLKQSSEIAVIPEQDRLRFAGEVGSSAVKVLTEMLHGDDVDRTLPALR